jgi:hypothetical protein
MRAIALVLMLALQDPAALVEQLGSDDITVRQRAAAALRELGPAARPALEKAARSNDLEIQARARTVLGDIAIGEQRAAALGTTQRVTLPGGDRALSAVIDQIQKQTGTALKIPEDRQGDHVTMEEARSTPLLEFVDRLCRAHGGIELAPKQPADAIQLVSAEPWRGPTCYDGPFRVSIERLRLEDRNVFDERYERGSFVFNVSWQPNVRPVMSFYSAGSAKLTVTEIVGDDDKPLEIHPKLKQPYSGSSMATDLGRVVRRFVPFERPAAGVRRLSRVRGHIDVLLPLKIDSMTFKNPVEGGKQERKAGDYAVILEKCESKAQGVTVQIHIEAPVEAEENPGKSQQRLEMRARYEAGWIELVGADGKVQRAPSSRSVHASSQDADGRRTESQDEHVFFQGAAAPAELRFRMITDYFERRVEFEFKDVELP